MDCFSSDSIGLLCERVIVSTFFYRHCPWKCHWLHISKPGNYLFLFNRAEGSWSPCFYPAHWRDPSNCHRNYEWNQSNDQCNEIENLRITSFLFIWILNDEYFLITINLLKNNYCCFFSWYKNWFMYKWYDEWCKVKVVVPSPYKYQNLINHLLLWTGNNLGN